FVMFNITMLVGIIVFITGFYLLDLVVTLVVSMRSLEDSREEKIDDAVVHALADADWPRYTVLCPLYKEAAVVPQFVAAMGRLDYPTDKLQILFLTEEDDAETREAILALQLPFHFRVV